jgi:hypothetical protein
MREFFYWLTSTTLSLLLSSRKEKIQCNTILWSSMLSKKYVGVVWACAVLGVVHGYCDRFHALEPYSTGYRNGRGAYSSLHLPHTLE